jgi:hypothetical protein
LKTTRFCTWLAGRDANRRDRVADALVSEHVVGARRLLDPPWVDLLEPPHRADRLLDAPHLVRVEGEPVLRTDCLAYEPCATNVALEIPADLHLYVGEPGVDRLPRERRQRRLRVTEPAGGGRVRREALGEHHLLALRLRRLVPAQERQRLLRGQCVVDVAEVDARDDLLRREVGEQLPQRLPLQLRVEVPHGIDERRRREMDHALLGPEPPQLRVADEPTPQSPEVSDELADRRADDVRGERLDRRDADFRSTPIVNVRPCPASPVGSSVSSTTYAAE